MTHDNKYCNNTDTVKACKDIICYLHIIKWRQVF